MTNPGKVMTIYDELSIARSAWPLSITPSNITSGFACTGIVPFNGDIFNDMDFAPSQVTYRAHPNDMDPQGNASSMSPSSVKTATSAASGSIPDPRPPSNDSAPSDNTVSTPSIPQPESSQA